ncbi:MAG: helical backbone metal receptor [Acidobacteriota bacterium]
MTRRRPDHVWETKSHRAYRLEAEADESRRERLELRFENGDVHVATLELKRQVVPAAAAEDPDLVHAVSCWLVARGARSIRLRTDDDRTLMRGDLTPASLGRQARPEQAPSTLVTLAPSNAEMVDALRRFDRVVACEESSDHPPECAERERLGPDLNPDLDRVAELSPDLVVSSLSVPGMERVVTGLRARGLDQVVLAPRSLDDVQDEAALLGRVLHADDEAATLVADMKRQRNELEDAARAAGAPLPVYLEWWPKPMFSPGADCYSNELIALAGGRNVFGERSGSSLEISAEDLQAAAPAACFVSWCGVDEEKLDVENLLGREGLSELDAVKTRAVFPLDERFSGRPGPRMLEASRRMAAALATVRDA